MRKYLISAAALLLAAPCAWGDPPSDRGRGHESEGQGRGQAESSQPAPPQGGRPDRGDHGRGPAPQAAMQPQNQPSQNPDRGNRDRGPAPQFAVQAPPSRGDQNRGFDRGNRTPAPQASIQAPPNRGDQNRAFDRGDRNRGPAPQASIQAPPNRGDQVGGQYRGGDNGRRMDQRGPDNRSAFNSNRDFNRDGRTDYRSPQFGGPRHDFSGFRDYHRDFRASHRFQMPSYRRPAGWYTHRWAFGEFLPGAFWARDYWLIDFADYDLPPPPFGAVWVRVDRDALLIDEESGEIITVAYDVFY